MSFQNRFSFNQNMPVYKSSQRIIGFGKWSGSNKTGYWESAKRLKNKPNHFNKPNHSFQENGQVARLFLSKNYRGLFYTLVMGAFFLTSTLLWFSFDKWNERTVRLAELNATVKKMEIDNILLSTMTENQRTQNRLAQAVDEGYAFVNDEVVQIIYPEIKPSQASFWDFFTLDKILLLQFAIVLLGLFLWLRSRFLRDEDRDFLTQEQKAEEKNLKQSFKVNSLNLQNWIRSFEKRAESFLSKIFQKKGDHKSHGMTSQWDGSRRKGMDGGGTKENIDSKKPFLNKKSNFWFRGLGIIHLFGKPFKKINFMKKKRKSSDFTVYKKKTSKNRFFGHFNQIGRSVDLQQNWRDNLSKQKVK